MHHLLDLLSLYEFNKLIVELSDKNIFTENYCQYLLSIKYPIFYVFNIKSKDINYVFELIYRLCFDDYDDDLPLLESIPNAYNFTKRTVSGTKEYYKQQLLCKINLEILAYFETIYNIMDLHSSYIKPDIDYLLEVTKVVLEIYK